MDTLQTILAAVGKSQVIDGRQIYEIASTKEIAKILGVTTAKAYQIMSELEKRKIAYKYGYKLKGGWEDPSASNMQYSSLYWQMELPLDSPLLNQKNVDDIIKEEVQKFVGEQPSIATTNKNFVFVQQIPKIFFYNYSILSKEYDVDIKESNISVTWEFYVLTNSSGIQKVVIGGKKVEGSYTIELYDTGTNELKEQKQGNIEEDQWNITVEDDVVIIVENMSKKNASEKNALEVKDLEFDFKNKTCKLSFM